LSHYVFCRSQFSHQWDARNQKLRSAERAVRNQDKNTIIADSWYLPQNLGDQCDPWNWRRMWITAALGQAAANETIYGTAPEKGVAPKLLFLTDRHADCD
jgi:hypothetical protein